MNIMKGRIPVQILSSIKAKIDSADKITVISHVNPDGDAIGSLLGVLLFLRKHNKDAVAVSPNNFPEFLKWMPASDSVLIYESEKQKVVDRMADSDLIILLDLNDPGRLGKLQPEFEKLSKSTIILDHHPEGLKFTEIAFIETSYCATAELVFELFSEIYGEDSFNKEIAECLMAGIMTDTGSFSFSASDPRLYRSVARLLEAGANKDGIFYKIYDNYSSDRMKLMGYALNSKMIVKPEYRTAYISLGKEELKEHNYVIGDTEGFVNLPLSIKDIVFSVFFMQRGEYIKLSFRSKEHFFCNEFAAEHFSGGGHKYASGGEFKGSLQDAIKKFESLLPLYENKLNADR